MLTTTLQGVCLLFLTVVSAQQRVAPGVPPQQYQEAQMQGHQINQQHPPPPQYQQPPVQQYQQVPVQQHQQVPVQQHQVPVQPQQVPVQQQQQQMHAQGHGHHQGHHGQQPVLSTGNIAHEREHIAEHMEVPIDTSKMTEQELQFHYFKMHDSDNNNKLDGCELIKSLIHWHDAGKNPNAPDTAHPQTDDLLEALVDPIIDTMDTNKDGFISYTEYRTAEMAKT